MPADAIDIDASLVRRLVAAQFPRWADRPVRPVDDGGWDHRTFRLGEDMLLRVPSAPAYAAQVPKEHRWLPRLAPYLPLAVPVPLALGVPSDAFPCHWGVYRWIEGDSASVERVADVQELADALGGFLAALQRVDATGGPAPGPHNFFRGGPLATYDAETRAALARLRHAVDVEAVSRVWDAGLDATWPGPPVWLHGDVSPSNLLVRERRLSAVIDFGCSGVGDPACDLAIAWTLFEGPSRDAFRTALPLDRATWARGRGWALWKSLITLAGSTGGSPSAAGARHTIDEVLSDHDDPP